MKTQRNGDKHTHTHTHTHMLTHKNDRPVRAEKSPLVMAVNWLLSSRLQKKQLGSAAVGFIPHSKGNKKRER
jgi:hypothetical protein